MVSLIFNEQLTFPVLFWNLGQLSPHLSPHKDFFSPGQRSPDPPDSDSEWLVLIAFGFFGSFGSGRFRHEE